MKCKSCRAEYLRKQLYSVLTSKPPRGARQSEPNSGTGMIILQTRLCLKPGVPRGVAENRYSVPQVLVSSLSAGTDPWSTEASHEKVRNQEGDGERMSVAQPGQPRAS